MVQINWTRQSRTDLKEIVDYISFDSVKYAKFQVDRIVAATRILKSYPKIGRVVKEIGQQSIREIITGNYRIIYKIVSEQRIDILTIHHSARDLRKRMRGKD